MKFGWCSGDASPEQHARCRATNKGSGVHAGMIHVCSCPCHAEVSVEEALEALI